MFDINRSLIIVAFAAAIIATCWSRSTADELRPMQQFKITVLEQVRHDIIIEADQENAARAVGLLEARRMSTSSPSWNPPPPMVKTHVREATGFDVIDIEPLRDLARECASRSTINCAHDASR